MGPAWHVLAMSVLLVVVGVAYSNFFVAGFALDNKFIILEDPRLRQATKQNIRLILTEDYWWPKAISGLYRPLTTLSYLFNYAVLDNADHAVGYVAINLALHWLNTVLVYFMVLVVLKHFWPALCTAAVFGVHPVTTESVINIVGRADLFATAAMAGAFLCYAKSTTMAGWRKLPWLTGLMLVTAVGVFCKESTVVVLGVIALYDFTYRLQKLHPHWLSNLIRNFWGFFWKGYVALVPVFVALLSVRHRLFERMRPPEQPFVDNPLFAADFWTGRLTAIKVIGNYFKLFVWPRTLSCDYSYDQVPLVSWEFNRWEDWKALVALVVVVTVVLIAVRHYRRSPAVFFFVMFFFITLFPTANLIKIIGSIMAERFLYMPSIGFAGCLVLAAYAVTNRVTPRKEAAVFLVGLAMVAFGTRTYLRNFDWRSDVTLWTNAAQACPDSFKTHKSLAYALYEVDPQLTLYGDRIIDEAEKSVAIMEKQPLPDSLKATVSYLHLGVYYRVRGDGLAQLAADGQLIPTEQSKSYYQKSVEMLSRAVPIDHAYNELTRAKELRRGKKPEQIAVTGNPEIYFNLATACMRLGKYQDALDAYAYMRKLAPGNPDVYVGIGTVFIAAGNADSAIIALMQALLIDSNRRDVLNQIVDIYRQAGQLDCAVDLTQAAPVIKLDCQLVRSHICSACYSLASVFLEAKQMTAAQQIRDIALKQYACPPEAFNELIPATTDTARSSP
jgi:tetratricopeptide (TPR) repeat protein